MYLGLMLMRRLKGRSSRLCFRKGFMDGSVREGWLAEAEGSHFVWMAHFVELGGFC